MQIPEYLVQLETAFRAEANPAAAQKMSRYMKDQFAYYGISSPERRHILKDHIGRNGLIPAAHRENTVKWCWQADQREWQYICMELLGRQARKADEERILLYEWIITNKSWWDTVDYIASNLVGMYFLSFPDKVRPITQGWMASGQMWLQRTCLLFQLKYKDKTDAELLSGFIDQLKDSREFFIRKAIGWALRQFSRTDPDFVISFVKDHRLSGLSEREALKWLSRKGQG